MKAEASERLVSMHEVVSPTHVRLACAGGEGGKEAEDAVEIGGDEQRSCLVGSRR